MRWDDLEAALKNRPVRVLSAPTLAGSGTGRAAVAVVFRPGPDLLFIRRSDREDDPWSGHMAFPGGRMDPADPSVEAAAEREVREEVGVDLAAQGRLIGRLDDQATPARLERHQLVISPFVYGLESSPRLVANDEVASIHWFALDRLRSGEGRGTMTYAFRGQRLELPVVRLDGVEIWGITLRVLDDLLARLG